MMRARAALPFSRLRTANTTCTAVGKHGGGVVADAGAGDHNDAPALIGDVLADHLRLVGGHKHTHPDNTVERGGDPACTHRR